MLVKSRRFVYDDWNMIVELDAADCAATSLEKARVLSTYVWGPDLAGQQGSVFEPESFSGAGGVGGLLAIRHQTNTYYPCMDANGNIMGLVNATAGTLTSRYDYDPFGARVTDTGPTGSNGQRIELCPFGFSTKYTDSETGLAYYGYRVYDPPNGRWPSRDPIGERGGVNLYRFCLNNPLGYIDYLGWNPTPTQGGFGFSGWTDHDSGASEDGNFRDRAGGRDNSNVGGGPTGKDLLEHMKQQTKGNCCIKDYRIAGHGWASGRGDGIPSAHTGDEEGFSLDKNAANARPSKNGDVRDVNDLKAEIAKGDIKFCKPCTISIFACRVSDAFIQGLASATGCKVTASGGACRRNPNGGGWESNADKPGDTNQFRQSDGGTAPTDAGHTYQPPLFP